MEAEIVERAPSLGLEWTILRPTLPYGAGLDSTLTPIVRWIRFLSFMPIYPPAAGKRQPIHADDLGKAACLALASSETIGKSYNLSGGEIISWRAMLERLFAVCGKPARLKRSTTLPFVLDMLGRITRRPHINGEMMRRMNDDAVFFHDDAKRDFGYAPRAFLRSGRVREVVGG